MILFCLGYLLILISLIPLIRKDNWIFRIFEYPRSQKLFLNIILLVIAIAILDHTTHDYVFIGALSLNAVYLFYQIFPYTFIKKHQIKRAKSRKRSHEFKLMISNVYQDNRDVESCLRSIARFTPDIVLLVETDHWWKSKLDALSNDYPHQVAMPLDNTYGMVLYSKFKLIDPEIKFLIENDIPSIHTQVLLPSGQRFLLYCLHPKPPVPQESARSTERDAEILMVAKMARKSSLPVVVAGDMNDVAWSYTTDLFLKISRLLDPRIGRGFFSTFHAKHWFMRWPLDHVFCSTHFHLCDLKRLPSIGSDHFPILIELLLEEYKPQDNQQEVKYADRKEEEMADEKIASAQ